MVLSQICFIIFINLYYGIELSCLSVDGFGSVLVGFGRFWIG